MYLQVVIFKYKFRIAAQNSCSRKVLNCDKIKLLMLKNYKISIIGGGGRVGLPLGIVLASKGHKVIVIESDENKIEKINNREMPFYEKNAEPIFKMISPLGLKATKNQTAIGDTEICIVIIGTPVSDLGIPADKNLVNLVEEFLPYLTKVKLLILRSTVYPGVTNQLKLLLQKNDLATEVVFCPERIAEGEAIKELQTLPQIIGAETDNGFILASSIFESLGVKIVRTGIEEAELVKLFSNAFRYLNFAIANEFFMICINKGINWETVWNAAKLDYPRNTHLASPGFSAGPCLVKDTQQLNYYMNGDFSLGKQALEINEKLPDFLINYLSQKFDLAEKIVGILGMTFKGNVDDFRDSLSFRLKNLLEGRAKGVLCSDELLQKDYFIDQKTLINKSDIIIIASPHNAYKNLVTNKILIDIWRVSKGQSIV